MHVQVDEADLVKNARHETLLVRRRASGTIRGRFAARSSAVIAVGRVD